MAGETIITVVGNLTADPDLRYTPNGAAVANLTVASTPRIFDRSSGEFKDGETMFLRCNAWRELGENVTESLKKGTRVVVQGRLKSRSFDTKEGDRRTVFELDIDEIGPSLRYATAEVRKNEPRGGYGQGGYNQGGYGQGNSGGSGSGNGGNNWGGNQGYGNQGNYGGNYGGEPDPWASSRPQSGGSWGNPDDDQMPPF